MGPQKLRPCPLCHLGLSCDAQVRAGLDSSSNRRLASCGMAAMLSTQASAASG